MTETNQMGTQIKKDAIAPLRFIFPTPFGGRSESIITGVELSDIA